MLFYLPELDEERQGCEGDEDAVGEAVTEKEQEELVVGESNTVVHPGAVVVHLQDADPANTAVVAPVWLQVGALFTITH